MAFVNGPKTITFSFIDDDLAQSSISIKLLDTVTLDAAYAFAQDMVTLLVPVSDCALQKYSVSGEIYDDTYPQGAAGSDVEDKGVLTIRTVNNGTSTITWPGIKESLLNNTITPPGTYIDLTNANVAALITALVNGLAEPLLGTIQPSNKNGQDFLSIKEAYKQNRGSQKSRQFKG
jgi:hypothetical protein